MSAAIGIDVGSTTAKLVVISAQGELLHAECARHHGRPLPTVHALRQRASALAQRAPTAVAGSLGVALAPALQATPLHEVQALSRAAKLRATACRSIVELGGQDAKILTFEPGSERADFQMNDRCAAGTGATIDRIVRRMGAASDALQRRGLAGELRVAAKCGVFAETDLVNWLQRGASQPEVLSALARAIVVQNLAVLARGRVLRPPVLLLGGPHAHWPLLAEAWQEALSQLWAARGVESGPIEAPPDGHLYVAHGAALHALEGGRALMPVRSAPTQAAGEQPLLAAEVDRDELARLRVARVAPRRSAAVSGIRLGLDAGSTSVKGALLGERGELLASCYRAATGAPLEDARTCLRELFASYAAPRGQARISAFGLTGYGAQLLSPLLGADLAPVETLAHARAARSACPDAEVVVDVGGTDIKVLRLAADGSVAEFFVSNHCSAGHGAFLASAAADMGVPLHVFAERALAAPRAPRFSVGCAVFMDSDRVTLLRDGYSVDEILAGLCVALARNVWEFVVPEAPARLGRRFVLTGGAQRNLAAVLAQVKYLRARVPNAEVTVCADPELSGAIGAALLAGEQVARTGTGTRFPGLAALTALRVAVQTDEALRCTRCEVRCSRSVVQVTRTGASASWLVGNACERGADVESTGRRGRAHAPDLFSEEARGAFRWPARPVRAPSARRAWPVIGVPRVLGMYRAAPLLLGYLQAAGVPRQNVIISPTTSAALFQDGSRRGANDPCFPTKLIHAHVEWLLSQPRRIDALLMPTITHAAVVTRGTSDCASCPIVAASGYIALAALRRERELLRERSITPLLGELCLADPVRLEPQLYEALGAWLELDGEQHRAALEHGAAVQRALAQRRRARGARVLAEARARGRAVAVVLSRPYHADPGVQHGVSTQLAAAGIPVLGIASLPLGSEAQRDLATLRPELTNSGSAEKLWAARSVLSQPGLVAVDLSSFRCGQDASILGDLTDLLGRARRPTLWLHDLDEDRAGESLRLRIDTFVAAVRGYERSLWQPVLPCEEATCTADAR